MVDTLIEGWRKEKGDSRSGVSGGCRSVLVQVIVCLRITEDRLDLLNGEGLR